MTNLNEMKELRRALKTFAIWIISSLIDSAFIVLWALTQWATNKAIVPLWLSDLDQLTLNIFQILFAFSTLIPVIIYIYQDIALMMLRAKRRIRQERDKDKPKGPNNV